MLGRAFRILGFALLAIFGLGSALALTAAILISRGLTPESLSARLTGALGRETTVETVALHLLPFPHVAAERIDVADLLTARRIEVGPSIAALARGRLVVASIDVEGPTVEWRLGDDGSLAELRSLGSDGDGLPELPLLKLSDGRLLVREPDGGPVRDEIHIERLRVWSDWDDPAIHLDLRAALGAEGMAGLLHAKGTVGGPTRIVTTLRAVQAERLVPYAPPTWDLRAATGVVDGTIEIGEAGEEGIGVALDLTLRGGGADVAGLKIAGEAGLSGAMTFDEGPFRLEGARVRAEAVQISGYSATQLRGGFDWRGDELEVHGLELGTLSAGSSAAAALGIPDVQGVPVRLVVEDAGKLSLRGSLSLPSPQATNRRLSIPSLTSVGTRIALVHDPGADESVTRIHLERLQIDGYGEGETVTAALDATIDGGEPGTLRAEASLGPLRPDRDLLDHPVRVEATLEGAPPESVLPWVPEGWAVPRELGTVDLSADLHGSFGAQLTGDLTLTSRFGSAPDPVGTLVAHAHAPPGPSPEDSPISLLVDVRGLDVALLDPLPESWRLDAAAGSLDVSAALQLQRSGDLEGDFEGRIHDCQIDAGEIALRGTCRGSGQLLRTNRGLSLPAFDLSANAARYRNLGGDRFAMRGLLVPPTLQIESARVHAWDGTVEVGGAVLLGQVPRYEFEITAIQVDTAKLQGAEPDSERARDPNRLDGHARVRGVWRESGSWLANLEGGGQLDLYGGAMVGMPLRRAIAEALLSVVPGTSLVVGDRPLPRTKLERAAIPFSFEDGYVRLEGVEVVTPDYRLRAYGRIQHDFSYRFDGNVNLTSDGLRNTLAYLSAPRITRRTLTLPAIPLDARGSLLDDDAAEIRVDATEITVNVARGLLGLPVTAGTAATGAVRRGLGALRPGARGEEATEGAP